MDNEFKNFCFTIYEEAYSLFKECLLFLFIFNYLKDIQLKINYLNLNDLFLECFLFLFVFFLPPPRSRA